MNHRKLLISAAAVLLLVFSGMASADRKGSDHRNGYGYGNGHYNEQRHGGHHNNHQNRHSSHRRHEYRSDRYRHQQRRQVTGFYSPYKKNRNHYRNYRPYDDHHEYRYRPRRGLGHYFQRRHHGYGHWHDGAWCGVVHPDAYYRDYYSHYPHHDGWRFGDGDFGIWFRF